MSYYEKKIKGTSIYEKNGSYYLKKMINREWLRMKIGRVGLFDDKPSIDRQRANAIASEHILNAEKYGVATAKKLANSVGLKDEGKSKTLKDVLEDYFKVGSKRGTRKTKGRPLADNTIKGYKFLEAGAFKPLMDLPIASISLEVLEKWYLDLHDEGIENNWTSRHNEALKKLKRLFAWAVNKNWIEVNYAERLFKNDEIHIPHQQRKKDPEKRLDLKTNELGRFVERLLNEPTTVNKKTDKTVRDFLLVYILSGGRYSEIKQLQWDWFDSLDVETGFESWTSPAKYTKTKVDYYYPCCVLLKEIFVERYKNRKALSEEPKTEGKSAFKYVFPNGAGTKHLEDCRARIEHIRKSAGIKKRIGYHTFRFTFEDICEENTDSDNLVIRALHHKNKNITFRVYGKKQDDDDKLRQLFQDVEDYISERLPLMTTTLTGDNITYSGTEGLARDNRTKISDIKADKEALRDIVMGRRSYQEIASSIPEVQQMNIGKLKEKFPWLEDNYFLNRKDLLTEIKKIAEIDNDKRKVFAEVGRMIGKKEPSVREIATFYDESKLNRLVYLRKKVNIIQKQVVDKCKELLKYVEVEKYITNTVNELIANHFVEALKSKVGNEIYDKFKAESDSIERLKLMNNLYSDFLKEYSRGKSQAKQREIIDRNNIRIKITSMNARAEKLINKIIETNKVFNPILDRYYIDLKKKHKDTKDNKKIIWLNRVKTSIDRSTDLPPTLEVK